MPLRINKIALMVLTTLVKAVFGFDNFGTTGKVTLFIHGWLIIL